MGIDGIGKGGGVPPTPEAAGTSAAKPTGEAFKVERAEGATEAREAGGVSAAGQPGPLAQLKSGAIDVEGYVDLKVDEATANLKGLSPGELDEIKRVLRDQMVSDPGLVDLVRTASGQAPKLPEE
jgi:hypothetical protein